MTSKKFSSPAVVAWWQSVCFIRSVTLLQWIESCLSIQSSSNLSNDRPRSEPALELYSRATTSVGIMYRSSGPNTGSNSEGGWIQKKKVQSSNTLDLIISQGLGGKPTTNKKLSTKVFISPTLSQTNLFYLYFEN